MPTFKAGQCPDRELAMTNCIYCSPEDGDALRKGAGMFYVQINKEYTFQCKPNAKMTKGSLGFNQIQRKICALSLNADLNADVFDPPANNFMINSVAFTVDFPNKASATSDSIDAQELSTHIVKSFSKQIFQTDQTLLVDFAGVNLSITVGEMSVLTKPLLDGDSSGEAESKSARRGLLFGESSVTVTRAQGSTIKLTGTNTSSAKASMFRPNFSFESMGIGGLDKEFTDIFRRAFTSRVYPASVIKQMGMKHVKGMLLYGPPGCGKTLIARQIGKMLASREPKIVAGPEILNKYVGQSEENIRALFAEAEAEEKERGDESELHIIIFDEIDAICKARGMKTSDSGVGDQVVNQLLSKIDGVDELNNVLLIGMTNRKDLLDPAMLRPGRLEVHCEIGLPDEKGRVQILKVHTSTASKNGFLGPDVDLDEIAKRTKNFSGAEIAGLCRSAVSWSLMRGLDPANPGKQPDPKSVKCMFADFEHALQEVHPSFGANEAEFQRFVTYGMIPYGPRYNMLLQTGLDAVERVRSSANAGVMSVLLEGPLGTGKSALAAKLALTAVEEKGFPFAKLVSSEDFVGMSEPQKAGKITQMFEDAYKSELSCLILDDIERLVEYVKIGPRFSNVILQTLLVLIKKLPPKGRRLLIIGTTAQMSILEHMEIASVFSVMLNVPTLSDEAIKTVLESQGCMAAADIAQVVRQMQGIETHMQSGIGIKQLLMVLDMARTQGGGSIKPTRFLECLSNAGFTGFNYADR